MSGDNSHSGKVHLSPQGGAVDSATEEHRVGRERVQNTQGTDIGPVQHPGHFRHRKPGPDIHAKPGCVWRGLSAL